MLWGSAKGRNYIQLGEHEDVLMEEVVGKYERRSYLMETEVETSVVTECIWGLRRKQFRRKDYILRKDKWRKTDLKEKSKQFGLACMKHCVQREY